MFTYDANFLKNTGPANQYLSSSATATQNLFLPPSPPLLRPVAVPLQTQHDFYLLYYVHTLTPLIFNMLFNKYSRKQEIIKSWDNGLLKLALHTFPPLSCVRAEVAII